jgi:carbonic anhydrase
MRLFEAIVTANHRALAEDSGAGLHPDQFAESLPIVALTCIDPRLNRLMPDVLGVREDDFIWLRNAGNIIFDPFSSMMRTLSLACALKGGKEIAIIGHTECKVGQTSVGQLIDCFRTLGIDRSKLPDNLVEFFGLFSSERQNVINGVDHVRNSPLISPGVPVHGLMVDTHSGRLDWVVNGYAHP